MPDLIVVSAAVVTWKAPAESAEVERLETFVDVSEAETEERLRHKLLLKWISREMQRLQAEKSGASATQELLQQMDNGLITLEVLNRVALRRPVASG